MLGRNDDLSAVVELLDKVSAELAENRAELDRLCGKADEMVGAEPVEAGDEPPAAAFDARLAAVVAEMCAQLNTALALVSEQQRASELAEARARCEQEREILAWRNKNEEAAAELARIDHAQQDVRRTLVKLLGEIQ